MLTNAIDMSLFHADHRWFLSVENAKGAMRRAKKREKRMIPLEMVFFAWGDMTEETLAFRATLIPVMIAAGQDAVTAVAVHLIGACVDVSGSTITPFAPLALNAAGIPITDGIMLRRVILTPGGQTAPASSYATHKASAPIPQHRPQHRLSRGLRPKTGCITGERPPAPQTG